MNNQEFRKVSEGDRLSAKEHNKLTALASGLANGLHIQGYQDGTGFHTRRSPVVPTKPTLFRVISVAAGDGVYNCYEQTLDATEWADTAGDSKVDDKDAVSVEVLNLAEFDPEATYVAHLAANDLIVAWQKVDDEANARWFGLPLRQANADRPRIAYCKDDAGAAATIDCYLDTDGTGTEITVNCNISGPLNVLNEATRRLEDGDSLLVTKVGASWYAIEGFMITEDCDCVEA